MLSYLDLSFQVLSRRKLEIKQQNHWNICHGRKLEGNKWEYPVCFARVCPIFKMADFTAKRSMADKQSRYELYAN